MSPQVGLGVAGKTIDFIFQIPNKTQFPNSFNPAKNG
jgi:hypothetical protein